MKELKADLHIHTCLSPCAELEMSPRNIVKEAKKKGLAMIGICDHNSAENVPAVEKNARKEGITVIGGMEVTSREEVHILALFDSEKKLFAFQDIVYRNLHGTNDEKLYGEQVIVNEEEEVLGFSRKLLIGATGITIEKLVDLIHEMGGLAIAAHVDREGFGLFGRLGFMPEGLALDAMEIADPSRQSSIQTQLGRQASLPAEILSRNTEGRHRGLPTKTGGRKGALPLITSSDAHALKDIGKRHTTFLVNGVSLEELRKCFRGEDGREVRI